MIYQGDTILKRREFLKISGATGISALLANERIEASSISQPKKEGFDLHPFIKKHPDAVFVYKTNIQSKFDTDAKYNAGYQLATEVIVPSYNSPYPNTTRIVVKPNWTNPRLVNGKIDPEILGVHTDLHFMDGWLNGMRKIGPQFFFIRECSRPSNWDTLGYREWANKNSFDLCDLSSKPIWEQPEGNVHFIKVPDGVVFKEIGFMSPLNESNTFLLNIPKLKSHGMGITASVKNLQGTCTHTFHTFCTPYNQVRSICDKRYQTFFQDGFEKHIESLYTEHIQKKIPRWDRPGQDGGIWMEQWVNCMLDALSVIKPGLNIVEGIYTHEGDGLGGGPDGIGKDYLSNVILFGLNPLRVDIIAHWIAGHEPGNFGLFHIAIERHMLDVLDPHDIPVYLWQGKTAVLTGLNELQRIPLLTYYLARDYGKGHEPRYHLVDEEFDYQSWKVSMFK